MLYRKMRIPEDAKKWVTFHFQMNEINVFEKRKEQGLVPVYYFNENPTSMKWIGWITVKALEIMIRHTNDYGWYVYINSISADRIGVTEYPVDPIDEILKEVGRQTPGEAPELVMFNTRQSDEINNIEIYS